MRCNSFLENKIWYIGTTQKVKRMVNNNNNATSRVSLLVWPQARLFFFLCISFWCGSVQGKDKNLSNTRTETKIIIPSKEYL